MSGGVARLHYLSSLYGSHKADGEIAIIRLSLSAVLESSATTTLLTADDTVSACTAF